MCGIAIICDGGIPRDGAIERMTAALVHRGPDAGGCEMTEGCQLGHRRLQVIDPKGGSQPMWDGKRRYCITFNGEIYNFRELRSQLQSRGVQFRTSSDTEVLLLAFREFGESVVEKLNGQFAFAIWDDVEKSLFAARDRLGEKPLFFAQTTRNELLIASEVKGLVASQLINPVLNQAAIDQYLALLYVPPSRTVYQNIQTLAPGHALRWQQGRLSTWCYWQPKLSTIRIGRREAVMEIRRLIQQAVERQMVADVPVGAFLSGGLDSATIVALMSQQADTPVLTFSAGFGELINELPYAREVAALHQTRHHEITVNIQVAEMLEQMADVYDEPFGDSSNIPTYLISKFASERVKVALSGDAGDELFGGYDWYQPLLAQETLSAGTHAALFYRVASKLPLFPLRKAASRRCKQIRAKRKHPDAWDRHLEFVAVSSAEHRKQLWGGKRLNTVQSLLRDSFPPTQLMDGIDRACDFDLRCYLPGDILVKVDRAAMAHGLETRSPFLDVDLVEFVLSLPAKLRFGGPGLKQLLRDACGDLWPASIRQRQKQGFGAPIAHWLQRPDIQALLTRVTAPNSFLCDLLPGASQWRRLQKRRPHVVWSLLCLGLWLERRAGAVASASRAA